MGAEVEDKTRYPLFLPPSEAELEKNEARCEQILECRKQIKVWEDKLQVLLEEQEWHSDLARLRIDSSSYWESLSPGKRLDKQYILAALESKEIPKSLTSFAEDFFPLNIRTDRDIFLARLRHQDFEKNFHYKANLIIPPVLRDDKDIILKVLERQPLAIRTMPDYWRDDKDILRAVLKHPELPSDALRHFSKEVRSDAELMFQVFQHPKNEFSWIEYCSESLRDSKRFLTRVVEEFHLVRKTMTDALEHNIRPSNQILQYASKSLQKDFDFVMTCVRQSGMNLEYADMDLRQNEAIVTAACLQEGDAIEFCTPLSVQEHIVHHNKQVVQKILNCASPEILKLCLETHGHDETVVFVALLNEHIQWSMIPEQWRSNVDFLANTLTKLGSDRYKMWEILPLEIKRNFKVASAVSKLQSLRNETLVDAIESCPTILSDRQVIKDLFSNLNYIHFDNDVMRRILELSDIDIRNDKDIMLEAIKKQGGYWVLCSEQLRADEDFLLAASEHSKTAIRILNDINQMEYPNLVARILQKYPDCRDRIAHEVHPDLWQNRDVAMAWLSGGGEWLNWNFPPQFTEDKEMILTVIKHHWYSFSNASDSLKKDRAFVLEALSIDARIIQKTGDCIYFDDDIVLEAISRDYRTMQYYLEDLEEGEASFMYIVSFARKVRKRLREYRAFQDEFMGSTKETTPPGCLLPMLNQGHLMLKTYENKIASFAGILHEEDEIAKYERVSAHLAQWGL